MKSRSIVLARVGGLAAIVWGLGFWSPPCGAVEPFQAFLDKLRESGFHDAALMYLEEMKTSALIPADIKTTITYEEGRTYLKAAEDEKDPNQKGKFLDLARDKLAEFIQANSSHPLIASAAMQQGYVTVERGRMAVEAASRPSNAGQKDALLGQAREHFNSAFKVFSDAETKFEEKLNQFPKFIEDKEVKQLADRDQARADLLQAQLFASAVLYEIAKTYPADSKEAKKHLQDAADKYEKTYQRFRTRLAGLMARLKQGQCYQEMGDTRRALGLYADILGQPEELDALRKQRATAMYLSMQCWTSDKEKKDELAVQEGEKFLQKVRGFEDRQPEWLATRYYTALAAKKMAESLKGSKDPAAENTMKSYLAKAKEHANLAARYSGAYQDAAKALLRELTGVDSTSKEPTTFAEALERGRAAWDEMVTKSNDIKTADTLKKPPEEVEKLKTEVQDARVQALGFFRQALSLRDDQTAMDDVNNIRYYLALADFQDGRFYDAAVQAEFVATRYPNSAGARQCAKIVLASFLQGYNDKSPQMLPTKDFDMQKMVEMVQYMQKRWPKEPETDEAWYILLSVAVADRDPVKATEYLSYLPEDSPKRAEAELKIGQAWWVNYSLALRKEAAERPAQAELENMVAQAKAMLESGMGRMRAAVDKGTEPVKLDLVLAALSAAQIYIQSGQPDLGVKLLEDPKFGPLTLVQKNDPLVQQHDIPTEAFKAALRAYVGTQALDKAEAMMGELEKAIAAKGATGNQADLTKIYIALGRELEEQVKMLREAGKNDELKKVSDGFELFLKKIGGRETGNSFGSLNWVSETFYSLGSGFDTGKTLSSESKGYYEQSLATDKRMIESAAKDKDFAPSADAVTAVKLRLARCLRRLGQFQEGLGVLTQILKEKPQLLDAQTEAAYLLSDWAAKGNKPNLFAFAVNGTTSTVSKTDTSKVEIWGWGKLSNMLQLNKDYQKVYYEARYNVADCLVQQSQSESGKAKEETLKRARLALFLTHKFKPTMGKEIEGENWPEKFDALVKTIQKLLNEKPIGVKAFEPSGTPAAPAAAS